MKIFKNFNDLLALLLIVLIVTLWVLQGKGVITAMPEVSGATIAAFTIVIQYYFRRAPVDAETTTTTTTTTPTIPTPTPGTTTTPSIS